MSEFALIDSLRASCEQSRGDVALAIGDDAALLDVPAGQRLVACTDTLVEGVHFLPGTAPEDLGWKALAVNLSDLAAMGAEPAWALLALTLPGADAGFVGRLAAGFAELARVHRVALVGGDTTQGPLAITVTALGFVPRDAALTRAGAHVGDGVWVTGTPGDAAAALWRTGDGGSGTGNRGLCAAPPPFLRRRMDRPEPRITAGLALRGLASACIDVSDGLLADLGHVCRASGVGAVLELDALPLSPELRAMFDVHASQRFALTGGDDYELCFTAAPEHFGRIAAALAAAGTRVTLIGRIVTGAGVQVLDASGHGVDLPRAGWEHFAS